MPPEPKPGDLQNPVPGADAAPDLGEMLKSLPAPSPQPQGAASSAPDLGQMLQSAPAPAPSADGAIDPNAHVAGAADVLPDKPLSQLSASDAPQIATNVGKNIKELAVAGLAGLAENPEKSLDYVKKAFGDTNAKLVDGKVYFRNEGDKTFRPFSAGIKDLLNNKSLGGVLNVLASHSRDAAFLAGAAPTATAAAGLAATGVGLPEAVGVGALSGAGGGFVAQAADNIARKTLGLPDGGSETKSVEQGLAGGAVIGGAAKLATPALEGAANAITNAGPVSEIPGKILAPIKNILSGARLQKVLTAYQDINAVAIQSGMNIDTTSQALDSTAIGENLAGKKFVDTTLVGPPQVGRLQKLDGELSNQIGAVVSHADEVAAGKRTQLNLDPIKEQMKKAGFEFQTDRIPVPQKPSSEISWEDISKNDNEPREFTIERASPKPDILGDPNRRNVQEIADRYNELELRNKAGGFLPSEAANTTKTWQTLAEFDQKNPKSAGVSGFYKSASGTLASGRDKILQDLAPDADPAIRDAMGKAYSDYAGKTEMIQSYLKDFQANSSAKDFADSLISTKNNYQKVGFLREFLGDNSPEWKAIKGNWFSQVIDKNSTENFLDAKGFWSDIKAYDPKVLDQLIPPQEQASLKVIVDKLKTIPTNDFTSSPKSLDYTNLAVSKMFSGPLSAGSQVASLAHKAIFNISRANGPLADYMASDGLLSMAKKADTPAEKAGFINAADSLKKAISYSLKIGDNKVGYKYVPRPELAGAFNVLWNQTNPPPDDSAQPGPSAPPPRPSFQPSLAGASRFQPSVPQQPPSTMGALFGKR